MGALSIISMWFLSQMSYLMTGRLEVLSNSVYLISKSFQCSDQSFWLLWASIQSGFANKCQMNTVFYNLNRSNKIFQKIWKPFMLLPLNAIPLYCPFALSALTKWSIFPCWVDSSMQVFTKLLANIITWCVARLKYRILTYRAADFPF